PGRPHSNGFRRGRGRDAGRILDVDPAAMEACMVRARIVTAFALALVVASATAARASNCAGTSTGMIPLIDLGTGLYHGYPGGLYGAGSNVRPPAHDAAGIAIANALGPLDTLGAPDPAGRIVLISIGMSNCTQEFSTFVPIANADPQRDPHVRVIDCALGGQ